MSSPALDARLSDALASLREELSASRARLYTMDSAGVYRLAAASGFPARFGPQELLEAGHPLLERLKRDRNGFWANSPAEAGVLGPAMESEQYARTLVVPVQSGARMAGILELQDRTGGAAFLAEDLRAAEARLPRLCRLLEGGDAPARAVEALEPAADSDPLFLEPAAIGAFPPPPPLFRDVPEPPAEAPALSAADPLTLTRREVFLFKGFVNALLLDPAVDAVVFSLFRPGRGEIYAGARQPFTEGARGALLGSLETALASAAPGLPYPREKLFNWEFPFGRGEGEIARFAGVQSSLASADAESALLFSLVFGKAPEASANPILRETHRLVRGAIREARAAASYRAAFRSLVSTLLEPGGREYPRLKAHSVAVATLCRRFADALRLSESESERLTVAALLHDIGLRELSIPYERIAQRRPLDLAERSVVREHPARSATLLEKVEFPYDVAALVRHHHERFDGEGYPDRLAGERIPFGARVLAIVEAFDAMTAPHSYRETVPPEAALSILLAEAGRQFDPDLVPKFCDLIRSGRR